MTPRVSIILPVHDSAVPFFEQAVDSLLAQTYRDFELILMDDGSTDRTTLDALDRCAARDPRVRLFHEPHRGVFPTRNAAMARSRGEFICPHDSDDWSDPDRLDLQVRYLDAHPEISTVGSNVMRHQEDGTRLWVSRYPQSTADVKRNLPRMPFCHGAMMIRRRVFEDVGGYRDAFQVAGDFDLALRVCKRSDGANLPRPLYHYRYRKASLSATKARLQFVNARIIESMDRGATHAEAAAEAETWFSARWMEYESRFWVPDLQLLAGDYRRAMQGYLLGAVRTPWRPKGWLKFMRWLFFIPFPFLRRILFRGAPDLLSPIFRREQR